MYFKINPIQKDKYTDMGMINVDAQLYLEQGDEGYDKYIAEHFVTVPVIPEGGYTGKVNKDGIPVDQTDYDNWIKSLPTAQQLNPFCTHSIQFEHDVTEEEMLWCFEFALGITHHNYLMDDLECRKGGEVVNKPFGYSDRLKFYKGVKDDSIDETYLKFHPLIAIQKEKIIKAEIKINRLKNVDFTNVQTIGKYSVRK